MSAIEIVGVGKSFGANTVLGSIDLTVAEGSRTVIVGSSGSGKTTLLRLLSGFDRPDVGSISVAGRMVAGPGVMIPAHRRGIGHVAQDGALFPHLTVGENIAFGLDRGRDRRSAVCELLELVALDETLSTRRPDQLSGGQQQRVALARALARRPSVMLLDEPFSALDFGLRVATRELVSAALTRAGITTVLVTHDRAEALAFGDQLAVLREGRLVQVGAPALLYAAPADLSTARFLGDVVVLAATVADGVARCAIGMVEVAPGAAQVESIVMFRPEQLVVEPTASTGTVTGVARVVAVEFQGAAVLLTLVLDDESVPLVRIPVPNGLRVAVGDRVGIRAVGPATVFPAS